MRYGDRGIILYDSVEKVSSIMQRVSIALLLCLLDICNVISFISPLKLNRIPYGSNPCRDIEGGNSCDSEYSLAKCRLFGGRRDAFEEGSELCGYGEFHDGDLQSSTAMSCRFRRDLTSTAIALTTMSWLLVSPPLAYAESSQEIAFDNQEKMRVADSNPKQKIDIASIKLPYNHENFPAKQFLGIATVVVNMKLDDPQTSTQYPTISEIYDRYAKEGLHVLIFPTEQGYFEPDDDETCRAKAKEYYGFGDFPKAVVFDKVDVLGPSASPLYTYLTNELPTPNGYSRITLNYEKFLLNSDGVPIRRYPRKFSIYDMEADIKAVLQGEALPEEGPKVRKISSSPTQMYTWFSYSSLFFNVQYDLYQKSWREAKREAIKSEYAFRYNYNYYTSPDSMYRYKVEQDAAVDPLPVSSTSSAPAPDSP